MYKVRDEGPQYVVLWCLSTEPLVGALPGATVRTHVIHVLQSVNTEWNQTATGRREGGGGRGEGRRERERRGGRNRRGDKGREGGWRETTRESED